MYEYDPREPDYVWRYEASCADSNNYPTNAEREAIGLPVSEGAKEGDREIDTNLFFPPRDKELYKRSADISKAICWGTSSRPPCPVRKQCLLHAVDMEDTHGIYGGMSHRERAHLERKHKAEVAFGKTNKSFKRWILDSDDGTEDKARQFLKTVSSNVQDPNEAPGQYRTVYVGPARKTT